MTDKIDSASAMAERIRHLETELKKTKAAAAMSNTYTSKTNVTAPKPADNSLSLKVSALEREVEKLRAPVHNWTFLTTPLTSANFAGATLTNANNAIVDLSTEFNVPAAVKAVLMTVQAASETANQYLRFGPSATYNYAVQLRAQVTNISNSVTGIVPCNANGDVYLYVGTGHTMVQVYVWIWGYWL